MDRKNFRLGLGTPNRINVHPELKAPMFSRICFSIVACAILGTCLNACRSDTTPKATPTMTIAENGQAAMDIVVSATPSPAEKMACKELSEYLKKVTGADYAVISASEVKAGRPAIYLGQTSFAKEHGIDFSKLGDEEWIIRTVGDNLILAGGRPRGTLYAVYEFLEQQVGCHWLDEFTEVIPSKPVLEIKELNVREKPLFWDRQIYSVSYTLVDPQKVKLFEVRNKETTVYDYTAYDRSVVAVSPEVFGLAPAFGSPGNCHTFYEYSRDWQTNHPEYLAMDNKGERIRSVNSGGPGQICLTNPEVRKLMLEKLRHYIAVDREKAAKAGYPPPRIYSISKNDSQWFCQCPECKAFSEREGSNMGPLIDLVNSLADGIKDEYPEVLVETFGYPDDLKLPKTIRPRDNAMIRIAQLNAEYGVGSPDAALFPDMFRPMTHETNRQASTLVRKWGAFAKHLGYYGYWRTFSSDMAFPTPYANVTLIKSNLELLFDNNVEMVFVEFPEVFFCTNVSFFALKRWLGLKLMQNPRQDLEPLLQLFMDGYYGSAAGKMREYLDYMEQRVAVVPASQRISGTKAVDRPYLTPDFFITSTRLLDEAETRCGTNKLALSHVRRERIPVDGALYNMWDKLAAALPTGKPLPFEREAVLRRFESCFLEETNSFYAANRVDITKKQLAKKIAKFRSGTEKPPAQRVPMLKENAGGDVDKVDWAQAATIKPWRENLTGKESLGAKLSSRLAHDDRFLYLQLIEDTGTSKLQDGLESGDRWEIFVAKECDRAPYNQLVVTLAGRFKPCAWPTKWMEGVAPPATWDSGVAIKSDESGGTWKVFLAFPLAKLAPGGVKPGQKVWVGLYRIAPPPAAVMAWSPTFEANFHAMERFGELTLE